MIWWWRRSLTLLGSFMLILQFLQGIVLAGPVKRSIRVIREVYPEIEPEKLDANQAEVCIVGDVIYGADEPVPADQPCLKCKCQPPGVQCETTRCVKKPGCKAIHKSNKCCPEYQCECEHEGKFYGNGERLETPPGGECKVCYCRGGEVQCANVSCYIRTDCEGTTVPGKCCPKFDHCPPRAPLVDRLIPYTTQALTTPSNLDYFTSSNVTADSNHFTTTIYDIKEVTNNKINDMQTEAALSFEIIIGTQSPNETVEVDDNKLLTNNVIETSREDAPKDNQHNLEDSPKITIQEIIPEIKEIPITSPPKRETSLYIHQSIEDEENNRAELNDFELFRDKENNPNDLSDTESDSSEISEVYHHPPPVLKIGDQLLFLKKGELVPGSDNSTPLPVITIIGAEGLQRGTEDSSETHEESSQVQNPNKNNNESNVDVDVTETVISSSTTSSPSHIISFVKPRNTIEETTTLLSTLENISLETTKLEEPREIVIPLENSTETVYSDESNSSALDVPVTTELSENITVTAVPKNLTTSFLESKQQEDGSFDRSPEYPLLPDVMSPLNIDEPLERLELSELKSNISIQEEHKNTENDNARSLELTPTTSSDMTNENFTEVVSQSAIVVSTELTKTDSSEESAEDGREHTTPKGLVIPTMEDASVETTNPHEINKKDLIESVGEVLTDMMEDRTNQTELKIKKDVEIFDPEIVIKNFHSNVETTTKVIKKSREEESEEIFKMLNEEVATAKPHKKKPMNEEEEAAEIFKELLEEATSTLSSNVDGSPNGGDTETQLMRKVSDAIYRFEKKESKESLDTSILGILKEFFTTQNRFNKEN